MQPLEKFLKTSVGQNCHHRIERVPKLVMTPGFVDEILTGMARRHDLGPAFTTGQHMMSTCWNFSFTKHTRLDHKSVVESIANRCNIENGGRSGNRTHDRSNLQLGRPPGPFKAVSSSMPDFFQSWRWERDSHSRWGEPARWPSARTFPGKLLVYPDSIHNSSKWSACRVMLPGSALI